jgi:ribosomal protein L11 methyltransferase
LFDPKLSFGDGAHPTTRLASVALERACRARSGSSVLDLGSGTGVLAFVALLSGARQALGIDIDPVSIAAAEHNAELNGLAQHCRFCLPASAHEQAFDLVVANLEAPTLLSLVEPLIRYGRGAKRLILTGFLATRELEIAAAFESNFRREHVDYEEDWALLELVPAP